MAELTPSTREAARRLGVSDTTMHKAELACCRFDGHEDKIVTHEPESGYDETEVQPRVQD